MSVSARRQLLPEELRRRRRKLFFWKIAAYAIGAVICFFSIALLARMGSVRVSDIFIHGAETVSEDAVRQAASNEIAGMKWYFFPKNNTLLLSKKDISAAVLAAVPRIESVEVERSGTTGLTLTLVERNPHALWCHRVDTGEECYLLDAQGFIFSRAYEKEAVASGTPPMTKYFLTLSDPSKPPIGSSLMSKEQFHALDALREPLQELGFQVSSVSSHGDADIEMGFTDGKRVLLPRGEQFETAVKNLGLIISSDVFISGKPIDYIDLRFGNKVFYKEK